MHRPTPPRKIEYNHQYVLRPVQPEDIPQIEEALQSSLKELFVFMAWAHRLQGRAQFFDRVVTQWWNYYRGDEFELALFEKESGAFLVYTGFYPTPRINPNCYEIGFWTASAHQGKGLATLVTRIQIALIFEYFKGDRVEITSSIENKKSLGVIKKCGFQHEGVLRNFYPCGTESMFAQGYVKERKASLFSLTPDDRPSLAWYQDILDKTLIYPIFDQPYFLHTCADAPAKS